MELMIVIKMQNVIMNEVGNIPVDVNVDFPEMVEPVMVCLTVIECLRDLIIILYGPHHY